MVIILKIKFNIIIIKLYNFIDKKEQIINEI